MSHHEIIFGLLGLVVVLVIARTLRHWNADADDPFDIRDLFMENGKASKGAIVLMGSFAATTWAFVFYALTGRMTEGLFGIYGGLWITPVVARLIAPKAPEAP